MSPRTPPDPLSIAVQRGLPFAKRPLLERCSRAGFLTQAASIRGKGRALEHLQVVHKIAFGSSCLQVAARSWHRSLTSDVVPFGRRQQSDSLATLLVPKPNYRHPADSLRAPADSAAAAFGCATEYALTNWTCFGGHPLGACDCPTVHVHLSGGT